MDRWRIEPGRALDLADHDPTSTEGMPGDKHETKAASKELRQRLADLQWRLWAEHSRSLLVVLQAMDGGGKDGTIRNVFKGVNPQGVTVTNFKAPTEEELAHDFLWRIHRAAPRHGVIGIFNRSHYEDVLVVRVHDLVPEETWRARYGQIRDFERSLTSANTSIVKLFLHISKEEQAERFRKRLAKPEKQWKFNRADLDERKHWDEYMEAFRDAIAETSTDSAPWFIVPGDNKWARDQAVLEILVGTLERMDPQYPEPEIGLEDVVIE